MFKQLTRAIAMVIAGTLASGLAGGVVGAVVGRLAPSFVAWIHSPGMEPLPSTFDPIEFGLGLGVVSGLFLGAGASLFLAMVLVLREVWLIRANAQAQAPRNPKSPDEFASGT